MIKIAGLVLAAAGLAWAQTAGHEAAENRARTVEGGASKGVEACHADIERFCKGVEPGGGRIGKCLKKNKKKLSKRCLTWARHGGPSQVDEALLEIDKDVTRPTGG
jgi:hypothetical protein